MFFWFSPPDWTYLIIQIAIQIECIFSNVFKVQLEELQLSMTFKPQPPSLAEPWMKYGTTSNLHANTYGLLLKSTCFNFLIAKHSSYMAIKGDWKCLYKMWNWLFSTYNRIWAQPYYRSLYSADIFMKINVVWESLPHSVQPDWRSYYSMSPMSSPFWTAP